jgi:hypothetical protein
MKNVCVLIISSDTEYYNKMEKIWIKYMNNFKPNVICFFIKCSEDIEDTVEETGNTIYVKSKEFLSNILHKTVVSIKYILEKYNSITYIFRTNLSTFLNIPKYLENIDCFEKDNIYSGLVSHHDNTDFISGVCITLSRDVCEYLVLNYNNNKYEDTKHLRTYYEDVEIGRILCQKYKPKNSNNRLDLCNYTEQEAINKIKNQNEDVYIYRCKCNNRNQDIILLDLLYDLIYKNL